jgi:hypothetical protein
VKCAFPLTGINAVLGWMTTAICGGVMLMLAVAETLLSVAEVAVKLTCEA